MTLRWNREFTFQNSQVNTVALDYEGCRILFAGRRFLGIKNLKESKDTIEPFPCSRNEKYNSSSAEWNPAAGFRHQFAVTCNERVMLASIGEGRLNPPTMIKHHSRQVSHVNWHKTGVNQLATASADGSTLVWDARDSRRPVNIFTSIAGVNLVCWNKLSSYLLATAHDNDVRIWDGRKGTAPVQYIAAHSDKIYSMDWSETHEYQLASCSQDCTVKLFDMTNPKRAETVMHTTGPVWRVSYTPWGEGLMTAVIPSANEESTLQLWNISSHSGPVHSFVGPLDVIFEALWRKEGSDYELITWSRDQCLRAWKIEPFLQRLCGCPDTDARLLLESRPTSNDLFDTEVGTIAVAAAITEEASPILSLSPSFVETAAISADSEPICFEEELEYLTGPQWSIPNVTCDNIDVENRSCAVVVALDHYHLAILISFPPSYPYNAAPSFQIDDSSDVDPLLKTKLLKILKHAAQQRVRKNRTCLESCLGQLVSCLEGSSGQAGEEGSACDSRVALGSSPARLADPASVYSSFHDAYIPYPRYSGARFSSVGILVCFGRASRLVARQDQATPRSLSAATSHSFGVGSYPRYTSGSSQDTSDANFSFFLSERQSQSRGRGNRPIKIPRTVTVYDISKILFIHKQLAEKYVLDPGRIRDSCLENAGAAAMVGRFDLVQVWTLASLATANDQQNGLLWHDHPLSSSLVNQAIEHYAKISDIQTAAMLSCVFPTAAVEKRASAPLNGVVKLRWKGSSPYHTIHPTDTTLSGWVIPMLKHHRSNSWSQSVEEMSNTILEHREVSRPKKSTPMDIREELKRRYADVLYMWGLMERRTAITKVLVDPAESHVGLEFLLVCQNCKSPVVGSAFCKSCRRFALRCAICRVLVRGASNMCLSCGHGGHASHIYTWFATESLCPAGCGCNCASKTRHALD